MKPRSGNQETRMATRPVQIAEHTFPHERWAALSLSIRMEALAQRLGIKVDVWEEEGLGEAKGCFLQLGSGRIIMLREIDKTIKMFGEKGPTVIVDGADLAQNGWEGIVEEVMDSLGLSREDIFRVASPKDVVTAKEFVANVANRKPGS